MSLAANRSAAGPVQPFTNHGRLERAPPRTCTGGTPRHSFLATRAYPFCSEIASACARSSNRQQTACGCRSSSSPRRFSTNTRRAFLSPQQLRPGQHDDALPRIGGNGTALGVPSASDWATTAKQLAAVLHQTPMARCYWTRYRSAWQPSYLSKPHGIYPSTCSAPTAARASKKSSPPARGLGPNSGRGPGAATASRGWPASAPAWATPRLRFATWTSILTPSSPQRVPRQRHQTRSGFSDFTYGLHARRKFPAMEALHEMLLQCWSAKPAERRRRIRLFPPHRGAGTTRFFADLRAEVTPRVRRRVEQRHTWFRIVAERIAYTRPRQLGGRVPHWSRPGVGRVNDNFEWNATLAPLSRRRFRCERGSHRPPTRPTGEVRRVRSTGRVTIAVAALALRLHAPASLHCRFRIAVELVRFLGAPEGLPCMSRG